MKIEVEIEREEDGRFVAEIAVIPGAIAYGTTASEATARVEAIALRVVADRLEHGEPVPEILSSIFTRRSAA